MSAFYYFNEKYVRTFGMPATSDNPLWVPRYSVEKPCNLEEEAPAHEGEEEDDHDYE